MGLITKKGPSIPEEDSSTSSLEGAEDAHSETSQAELTSGQAELKRASTKSSAAGAAQVRPETQPAEMTGGQAMADSQLLARIDVATRELNRITRELSSVSLPDSMVDDLLAATAGLDDMLTRQTACKRSHW